MSRFPKTRYIPAGSTKVADKASDAIAYIYTDPKRGRLCAIVYYGKQTSPVGHHSYRTEAERAASVKRYFEGRQGHDKRRAESKAERLAPNKLVVGDILNTCWGYDQTNREFFEVTAVKGQYVTLCELAQASETTGMDQGRCMPQSGHFIGKPMRKLDRRRPHRMEMEHQQRCRCPARAVAVLVFIRVSCWTEPERSDANDLFATARNRPDPRIRFRIQLWRVV
jgi:hypothetical protein